MVLHSTHLGQKFQQTENNERHGCGNRQAELHQGKVDADIASSNVNVRQKDDECDGRLQEATAAAYDDNHWNTRRLNWWNLLRRMEISHGNGLFWVAQFITHTKALFFQQHHISSGYRATASRNVLHENLRQAHVSLPVKLKGGWRIESVQSWLMRMWERISVKSFNINSPANWHPFVIRRTSVIENNSNVRRVHRQAVVSGFANSNLLIKPRRDDLRGWYLVDVGP